MALVYFESSQLVLVVDKNCVGIVGKIGKSIGIHRFSADSDVILMVFVHQLLCVGFFSSFFYEKKHFYCRIFFHSKDMINSYGLKYVRADFFFT